MNFTRNFANTRRLQASFNVLKVNKHFTPEQIRHKYLKLVKIYHPDNTDTGNVRKFRQIVEAYDRIKQLQNDPESDMSHTGDRPDALDSRFSEEEYVQLMRKRYQQQLDFFQYTPVYKKHSTVLSFWFMIKSFFKL